jgi:hypothetical protein
MRHDQDQVKAVLERVPTWPEDRQQELAAIALEIKADPAGAEYDATPDELAAIDGGLLGRLLARRTSRRLRSLSEETGVEYSERVLADLRQIAGYYARSDNPRSLPELRTAFGRLSSG